MIHFTKYLTKCFRTKIFGKFYNISLGSHHLEGPALRQLIGRCTVQEIAEGPQCYV